MFRYNQADERSRLEKKLSRVGSAGWYAKQTVSGAGKLIALLYALNAGVQTMTLLQSDAYKSRESIAKNGYAVLEDLKQDTTFHQGVESYLQAKALVKPELRTTINELEHNIEVANNTQDEFVKRVEKIYNPLAVIGMN